MVLKSFILPVGALGTSNSDRNLFFGGENLICDQKTSIREFMLSAQERKLRRGGPFI